MRVCEQERRAREAMRRSDEVASRIIEKRMHEAAR
jgi:hypothetical protein